MQETPIIAPIQTDDYKLKLLEEKINSLRDLMNERMKCNDKALELQAKEYQRRLDALNHEADRLKDMQEKYVPREVFDRVIEDVQKVSQINSDYRIKQEGQGQGKGAYSEIVKWLLPVIITVVFFLIMYYKGK